MLKELTPFSPLCKCENKALLNAGLLFHRVARPRRGASRRAPRKRFLEMHSCPGAASWHDMGGMPLSQGGILRRHFTFWGRHSTFGGRHFNSWERHDDRRGRHATFGGRLNNTFWERYATFEERHFTFWGGNYAYCVWYHVLSMASAPWWRFEGRLRHPRGRLRSWRGGHVPSLPPPPPPWVRPWPHRPRTARGAIRSAWRGIRCRAESDGFRIKCRGVVTAIRWPTGSRGSRRWEDRRALFRIGLSVRFDCDNGGCDQHTRAVLCVKG